MLQEQRHQYVVSHEPQGWRMGWLPEVYNRGMVSGLSLTVRLVAVWRFNCRVARIEAWRLVERLFSRVGWW